MLQLNDVPEPEQPQELVLFEQRALLAAQVYAVPEPEQTSQLPVHIASTAAQLPELQTSQLPVQSEATSVHVPREPTTLQRLQLPVHRVLQQYPSTQISEAQSSAAVHEWACAKGACIADQASGK